MTDIVETFWRQFAIETEEHFELIEPLLVAAESGPVDAEGIAQLFRSFHSIKGLSRAMDLRGLETLSHHAENLLGLVRDGRTPLAGATVGLLLEATDVLRRLQAMAVESRADAPAPEELLRRLELAYHTAKEGGVPTGAAPAADAPPLPAAPSEDMEMLSLFVEMLGEQAPALAAALVKHGADGTGDAALEAADSLGHAAEVMEFYNVSDLCRRIGSNPALVGPAGKAERRAALSDLSFLTTLLEEFLLDLNLDGSGAAQLRAAAADAAAAELADALHAALEDVFRLIGAAESGGADDQVISDAAESCRELHDVLLLSGRRRAAELFVALEDALRRVAEGEGLPLREVAKIAESGLKHVEPLARPGGTLNEEELAPLVNRLHEAMLVGAVNQPDGVAGLTITPDLLRRLSPDQMTELKAAAAKGGHVYELTVDIESDQALASAFIAWLQAHVDPLNNRNFVENGVNWLHFLVISALEPAKMQAAFKEMDPSGRRLKLTDCRAAPAPTVAAAPAARPRTEGGAAGGGAARQANIMRVPGEAIDRFLARIGEMALASGALSHAIDNDQLHDALQGLLQTAEQLRVFGDAAAPAADRIRVLVGVLDQQRKRARQADEQLHSALRLLQEGAMDLRVVPIETVFNRFPRLVRDLSQAQGKQITLDLRGQEVRIDKGMVEMLLDPLMHMVRNAVDHGIETPADREAAGKVPGARLTLDAIQRGNRVIIEISDDGRGINTERVRAKIVQQGMLSQAEADRLAPRDIWQYIFKPGFSTAAEVTETSGRGVGMDVVMNNVSRLGGAIKVDSAPGVGSTFTLELPLSAAIQDTLLVRAGGQTFALPDRYVAEVHAALPQEVQMVRGRRALLLRGDFLPIFTLRALLGLKTPPEPRPADQEESYSLVVLTDGARLMAVEVDRLLRRQELFIKDVHPKLAAIPGVGGASILGDGGVVLILDGDDLFRLAVNAGRETASVAAE